MSRSPLSKESPSCHPKDVTVPPRCRQEAEKLEVNCFRQKVQWRQEGQNHDEAGLLRQHGRDAKLAPDTSRNRLADSPRRTRQRHARSQTASEDFVDTKSCTRAQEHPDRRQSYLLLARANGMPVRHTNREHGLAFPSVLHKPHRPRRASAQRKPMRRHRADHNQMK